MYQHFEDEISIGAEEADMIVDDPNMAPRHARVYCAEGKAVLENISEEHEIKINAKPLSPGESSPIAPRDSVGIGKTVFQFTKAAPGLPAPPQKYQHPQHDSRFAPGTKESAILKSLEILAEAEAKTGAKAPDMPAGIVPGTPPKPHLPPPIPRK